MSEELYEATQIVNASATEFMELVIRSISQYSGLCSEIMHMIIQPLVATLRTSIDNENAAQQVILLNLLKVILFENERLFFSPGFLQKEATREYAESAKRLFEDPDFFKIFTDGLMNKQAFVRYHYIAFVQKLVPLMQKVLPALPLAAHVGSLVDTFSALLEHADISAYEIQTRAGKNLNIRDADDEDDELEQDDPSEKKDPFTRSLEINQENDIVQIVEGFMQILDHCLGIRRQDMSEEERET